MSFVIRAGNRHARQRGAVMVYAIVMMLVVVGFATLAIDYGLAIVKKSELQRTADAAARYATQGISDNTYLAKAQTSATENGCSLQQTDVTLGTWASGAFTAGGSSPNAVKVVASFRSARGTGVSLPLARLFGQPTLDIIATSIAMRNSTSTGYGFVGLNYFNMNGTNTINSYRSTAGAYGGSNISSNASVASNSAYNMNLATVNGNLYYRGTAPSQGTVTGSKIALASNLSYTMPSLPASYSDMGNLNINGNYTFTSGSYYVWSLNVSSGTLTINASSGPVKLYIGGDMTLQGTASITVTNNLPSNLELYGVAPGNFNFNLTNANYYCKIYAPSSPLNINGNGNLHGTAVCSGISIAGTTRLSQDDSLISSANGSISTVK